MKIAIEKLKEQIGFNTENIKARQKQVDVYEAGMKSLEINNTELKNAIKLLEKKL